MKLVLFFLSLLPMLVFSQNKLTLRDGFELTLPLSNGNLYQYVVPESNYFVNKTDLQIYPTEELFIEVELNGLEIIALSVVKENVSPEKTLIIGFNQETKDGKKNIMFLKVHNPLPFTLIYKTLIYPTNTKDWQLHSPYKIEANKTSYEMFNTPIATIVLKNWKFE